MKEQGDIQVWEKVGCCFSLWGLGDVMEPRNCNIMGGEGGKGINCQANNPVHCYSDYTRGIQPALLALSVSYLSDVAFFPL